MKKFKIGNRVYSNNSNWSFSGKIVSTFDKHINDSVPLYQEGHKIILNLSDYFIKNNSTVYDIGSSTGQLLKSLNQRNSSKKKVKYFGIECVNDMIKFAKKKNNSKNINYLKKDIIKHKLKKNDLTISYYTLQFIPPRVRQNVINKIYKSLNWGGAFVFFEKVRGPDARFQDILTGMYNEFKLERGYEPEEIFNKTRSLKSVLEPFSTLGNLGLLKRAGFKDIVTIQKYICFEGLLAIK
tara:strand:- start:35 stop:751 length:717 start_codon:yes stop_codon:yes gene_type:complete